MLLIARACQKRADQGSNSASAVADPARAVHTAPLRAMAMDAAGLQPPADEDFLDVDIAKSRIAHAEVMAAFAKHERSHVEFQAAIAIADDENSLVVAFAKYERSNVEFNAAFAKYERSNAMAADVLLAEMDEEVLQFVVRSE